MDQKKIDFIKKFESEAKPDTPKEAMSFLATYLNEAKKKNITFTKEEIASITDGLIKELPPEKREQILNIVKLLN